MDIKLVYWRDSDGDLVQPPISNKQNAIKRTRILKNVSPSFISGLVAATYGIFSSSPRDNGLYIKIKNEKWTSVKKVYETYLEHLTPFSVDDEFITLKGDIVVWYNEVSQLFRVLEENRPEFIDGLKYWKKIVGNDSMMAEMYYDEKTHLFIKGLEMDLEMA